MVHGLINKQLDDTTSLKFLQKDFFNHFESIFKSSLKALFKIINQFP